MPPPSSMRLRGRSLDELTDFVQRAGKPAFRAKQLFQWLYEKGADSFESMTNLPKDFRAWLSENAQLGGVTLEKTTGDSSATQKLLFKTNDGEFIESVIMRGEVDYEADDEEENDEELSEYEARRLKGKQAAEIIPIPGSTPPTRKVSLCVSSQIGCTLGCTFCMTGHGGFCRSLRIDEILGQVIEARRLLAADERISNIVFMGMGEPMLNLKAVIPALRILTNAAGFNFAPRRITVSTAGVIPGIEEFVAAETGVKLAISLNATTQSLRDQLMPGCRSWPIENLLALCKRIPLTKRQRITFEYVLLKGFNDAPADVRRLKALLTGISCKINLILYNTNTHSALESTTEEAAESFRASLAKVHFTASLRISKGREHQAACGQLAGHTRQKR
ncbi:TPA: 23S rRNA (adenine(2503)-C(2))-methyltransferase RlmN [Candidatus Sumerlaeota bacterium]|jgi:23S rRNA (adenine2503-C2)-methyltransferase|nr:23S rRNA (adenine(2503)-C(2))-methyltransferase RlmN [Candidatus Sumerlaeota bacterium]